MTAIATEITDRTYRMWGADLAPPIIFETEAEARESALGDEYAGFDMRAHNLMINRQKIERELGKDLLEVILSHEVGHYSLSPFDLENMVYLIHEAKQVMGDTKLAKHIENLFTDTVVNSFIYKNDVKSRQKLVQLYNKMSPLSEQKPEAWQVYLRSYEKLWRLPENTLVRKVSQKVEQAADNISRILAPKSIDDIFEQPEWRDKVRKYAEEMKPFINEEKEQSCQKNQGQGGQGGPQGQSSNQGQGNQNGNNQQQGPGQAGQGHGSAKKELGSGIIIHRHDPKAYKQDEKTFGKVAEAIGKEEAKQIYAGLGLGSPRNLEDALIDSLAELYTIIIPKTRSDMTGKRFAGYQKASQSQFHKADIVYSVSANGILIPGYNTFMKRFKEASSKSGIGIRTPDLNLVLDTSSSMQNAAFYSVLAAKIAANSTLKNGGAVCVYNFSMNCIGHEQGFQRDKKKVYRLIEHQQNGGTKFPTKELVAGIGGHDQPQYLAVITDTAFSNVQETVQALRQVDTHLVGGAFLLVNTAVPLHADLSQLNYDIVSVSESRLPKEMRLKMKQVV